MLKISMANIIVNFSFSPFHFICPTNMHSQDFLLMMDHADAYWME